MSERTLPEGSAGIAFPTRKGRAILGIRLLIGCLSVLASIGIVLAVNRFPILSRPKDLEAKFAVGGLVVLLALGGLLTVIASVVSIWSRREYVVKSGEIEMILRRPLCRERRSSVRVEDVQSISHRGGRKNRVLLRLKSGGAIELKGWETEEERTQLASRIAALTGLTLE